MAYIMLKTQKAECEDLVDCPMDIHWRPFYSRFIIVLKVTVTLSIVASFAIGIMMSLQRWKR